MRRVMSSAASMPSDSCESDQGGRLRDRPDPAGPSSHCRPLARGRCGGRDRLRHRCARRGSTTCRQAATRRACRRVVSTSGHLPTSLPHRGRRQGGHRAAHRTPPRRLPLSSTADPRLPAHLRTYEPPTHGVDRPSRNSEGAEVFEAARRHPSVLSRVSDVPASPRPMRKAPSCAARTPPATAKTTSPRLSADRRGRVHARSPHRANDRHPDCRARTHPHRPRRARLTATLSTIFVETRAVAHHLVGPRRQLDREGPRRGHGDSDRPARACRRCHRDRAGHPLRTTRGRPTRHGQSPCKRFRRARLRPARGGRQGDHRRNDCEPRSLHASGTARRRRRFPSQAGKSAHRGGSQKAGSSPNAE